MASKGEVDPREVSLALFDHRSRNPPAQKAWAPELVFGLVGPTGSDFGLLTDVLVENLCGAGYTPHLIRLSELLDELPKFKDLLKNPDDARIEAHMEAGDALREGTGRLDAMALLSFSAIRDVRESITGNPNKAAYGHAYILRSLKHPREAETLREVYDRTFYLVAGVSSPKHRRRALSTRIARSHHVAQRREFEHRAQELMLRDEKDSRRVHGQNVRDTFPHADVFVDIHHPEACKDGVERFVRILFGYPFHTPRRDEFAMFHARAAALRSADLGRQVGAAIANDEGDVLAVGTNDIPKASGGQYWEGDGADHRDFVVGHDTTTEMKGRMLVEVVQRLSRGGYVKQDLLEGKDEELRLKAEHIRPILDTMSGTQLMGITEFGRSVHAEMAAVSDAAKRGLPIRGCTLYTTTFPCHNCAKHIVASGIRRVVYVEPYPKSLAGDLYPDSISIDGETAEGRVPFENFVGISPTRYDEFFSMPERKDDSGNKRNWSARDAVPRFTLIGSEEGYLPREKRASRNFTSLLIRTGFAKGLI